MVTRRIAEGYSAWVALAKQLQLLQLSQSDDRKCLWVTVTRSTVQSCRVGYGCHRQHRHFQWDDLEEGKYFTTKTTLLTRLPIVTRSTKLPPPTGLTALLWGTKVPVVANIARTQWHLRLVNCAFSGFASLKTALFIQLLTNEGAPLILLGHPLVVFISRC